MEPHKAPHSNSSPEKEQSWRNQTIEYQTILQGHSNKNSLILTYKQDQQHVTRLIKKKRERTQINRIGNERGEVTTDNKEIQRIVRKL